MSAAIAHLIPHYLPLSQNWIYTQLISQKKYQPIVLTRATSNLKTLPLKHIYKYPLWSDRIKVTNSLKLMVRKSLALAQRLKDTLTAEELKYYDQIIKTQEPQLIHAHFGPTGYQAITLKTNNQNVPLVVSFYGSDVFQLPQLRKSWVPKYQQIFQVADAIIAKHQPMAEALIALGCPQSKLAIIDQGILLNQIPFVARKPGNKLKLLSVGRLEPVKGFQYAIKALAQALETSSQIQLTIVGSGSQEAALKQLVNQKNLQNHVTFIPMVPLTKLIKLASKHHLYLHTSIKHGPQKEVNPNSLLERMASGMPVIAFSGSNAVKHNQNGYVVPPKDSQALAQAIIKASQNPQQWPKLGRAGRRYVQQSHSATTLAQMREGLYQKLIQAAQ